MRLTTTKKKEPELFDGLENIDENKYFVKVQVDEPTTWQCMANKLGQLEDIEEELGIALITLFKALNNGIYYKLEDGKYIKFNGACLPIKPHKLNINMKNKSLSIGNDNYYFKDYGKTWALTKEELDN